MKAKFPVIFFLTFSLFSTNIYSQRNSQNESVKEKKSNNKIESETDAIKNVQLSTLIEDYLFLKKKYHESQNSLKQSNTNYNLADKPVIKFETIYIYDTIFVVNETVDFSQKKEINKNTSDILEIKDEKTDATVLIEPQNEKLFEQVGFGEPTKIINATTKESSSLENQNEQKQGVILNTKEPDEKSEGYEILDIRIENPLENKQTSGIKFIVKPK